MVTRLILYLAILVVGGFVGSKGVRTSITSKMDLIQSLCLLFLLFIMGIRIGVDEKVLSSFFKLGYQAVIISVFSIFFSALLVTCIKGYVLKEVKEEEATNEF